MNGGNTWFHIVSCCRFQNSLSAAEHVQHKKSYGKSRSDSGGKSRSDSGGKKSEPAQYTHLTAFHKSDSFHNRLMNPGSIQCIARIRRQIGIRLCIHVSSHSNPDNTILVLTPPKV